MNSPNTPDITKLMEATVDLLQKGTSDSVTMRQNLAARFKLDRSNEAWRKFVNNHAWALVRLQAQDRIRKIAPGRYELTGGVPDATPPIREGELLPRWARVLVASASHKNTVRWGAEPFQTADLVALWKEGQGRCMLTGLAFRETSVGAGKARRPFAPSLDRIDSSQSYSRRNCRLVLQAVNFALNAWGDDVFLAMAEGAIKVRDASANAS
jgi:hypothetical protein